MEGDVQGGTWDDSQGCDLSTWGDSGALTETTGVGLGQGQRGRPARAHSFIL